MSATQYFPRSASPAQAAAGAHESWVDVVRLLAVFLIVFVHGLNTNRWFEELPLGSPAWVLVDVLLAGTRWASPVFVMISGYFLLDPHKSSDLSGYYRRRVRRIAWPLFAWTALYLGISACDGLLSGRPITPASMVGNVIRGTPYYHLWYLYMLPGLYLVAPFVKVATDHMGPRQLIAAAAICFAFTVVAAMIDVTYSLSSGSYITQFPRYLGYFIAGHLLGRVLPTPRLAIAAACMAIATLAVAALAWIAADLLSPARALRVFGFANPGIIVLSLAAFVLVRRLPVAAPCSKWLGPAAETSMGIYLVHPAIFDALQHWNEATAPSVLAMQAVAVFAVSLLLVLAMQRTPLLRWWV